MPYTVTQYADHLDPNPERFEFDTWDEAEDWYHDEIERRVLCAIQDGVAHV